jgi:hypothetical protein
MEDIMNQQELISLMEQWQNTNPSIYKSNIKRLAGIKGIKPKQIESALQVPNSTAKSYTNIGHPARIEFLTALKLAELLETNVEKFLENN